MVLSAEGYRRRFVGRLLEQTRFVPETGCWEMKRKPLPNGHAYIAYKGTQVNVRRAAYEQLVGPIPPGYVVVHEPGDVRNCGNPEHLTVRPEVEVRGEALRRGREGMHRRSLAKTVERSLTRARARGW